MRAAVRRVDVVDEREDVLGVGVVILHRHLDARRADEAADVNRLRKKNLFVLVDELDELADAALVVEDVLLRRFRALVAEDDANAAVEERHLAEAGLEHVVLEIARLENAVRVILVLDVRPEADGRAGALGLADYLEVVEHLAARILLLVDPSVLIDVDLHVLGERVDHRRADAVQTAGDLVAAAAELAARVQNRQADLDRGAADLRVNTDREAASVVLHRAGAVLVQRDDDLVAEARQRLVHRVVHDFIHQMVQAALVRRADIHARPLAHGLKPFENLNLVLVVSAVRPFKLVKLLNVLVFHLLSSFLGHQSSGCSLSCAASNSESAAG